MSYQDSFIVARDLGALLRLRTVKGDATLEMPSKTVILQMADKEVVTK